MQIPFSRPMQAAILAIVGAVTLLGGIGLARRAWQPPTAQQPHDAMYSYSATPEAAVDGFLKALNTGEYGQAARYYWTAPDRWQRDPLAWKFAIEQATYGKQIERFEHLAQHDIRKEDAMSLTGFLHFPNDPGPRQVMFDLVKKPEGWLIIRFD